MSKKRNRAKLNKALNGNSYKRILISILYPMYYDECMSFHNSSGRMNRYNKITVYEYRMYRTWKYNRKTKYKL